MLTPEESAEINELSAFRPDWKNECDVCGQKPIVSATGLCGPCTWGESDTMNGAWWDADDEQRYKALRAKIEEETPNGD